MLVRMLAVLPVVTPSAVGTIRQNFQFDAKYWLLLYLDSVALVTHDMLVLVYVSI
jgi:hypothetical protein